MNIIYKVNMSYNEKDFFMDISMFYYKEFKTRIKPVYKKGSIVRYNIKYSTIYGMAKEQLNANNPVFNIVNNENKNKTLVFTYGNNNKLIGYESDKDVMKLRSALAQNFEDFARSTNIAIVSVFGSIVVLALIIVV